MKHIALLMILSSSLALAPLAQAQPSGGARSGAHTLEFFVAKALHHANRARHQILLATGAICLASCAAGPAPGRPGPRLSGYTYSEVLSPATGTMIKIRTNNATGMRQSSRDGEIWESSVSIGEAFSHVLSN